MERYSPQDIESKWQKKWEEGKVYKTEADPNRPKYYALEMFPYPSGNLHMGHVRNYAIGDVMARYKTMEGFNVLHPMGFDSFGMPAENAAIKHGVKPADWTYSNIENMEKQQKKLGLSYAGTARSRPATRPTINGRSGCLNSSTSAALPTRKRLRSTGATRAARSSRTSRSSTASAGAATMRFTRRTSRSGSSRLRITPMYC